MVRPSSNRTERTQKIEKERKYYTRSGRIQVTYGVTPVCKRGRLSDH